MKNIINFLQQLDKRHCVVGWLFLLLMPIFKVYLPYSWGYENGVVEDFQMVWLFLGMIWCWREARSKNLPDWGGNASAFWYGGLLYYILLIGREVNWGRAFFVDDNGRIIQWEEMGFYGVIVHPLVCVFIIFALYLLWQSKFWIFLKKIRKLLPYPELCLCFFYVLAQYVGEHLHWSLWTGCLAEELAEAGVYIVLEWLIRYIKRIKYDFERGEWA